MMDPKLINKDTILNIFNRVEPREQNSLGGVNKTFHLIIEQIRYEMMESIALNSKFYHERFNWKIEDVKLPKNIYHVYNKIVQLSIKNNIDKAPILYLIDPQLELSQIGRIMQPFFEKKKDSRFLENMQDGFQHFDKSLLNKCKRGYVNHNPIYEEPKVMTHQKPYYGILVNGIIGQGKSYKVQKKLVADQNLQLPNPEEATIGIFLHWVKTGTCEFNREKVMRTEGIAFKSLGQCIVCIKGLDAKEGVDIELLNSHHDYMQFGVSPFLSF